MTLDELLKAARAKPVPSPASHRFWLELEHEIARFFARYPDDIRSELIQATLLVVWRKLEQYETTGPDSLRRWVRAIAAKEALRGRRRVSWQQPMESTLLRKIQMHEGWTPSREVLALERARLMRRALERLSARQRGAIERCDHAATATAERISIDAARMLLHRAIRKLAILIDDMRKTGRVRVVTSR